MIETPLALLAGGLTTAAIWLMLSGHVLRFLFGLLLLSNAINLAILAAGRITEASSLMFSTNAIFWPSEASSLTRASSNAWVQPPSFFGP